MAEQDGIYLKIDPMSVKKLEYSMLALGEQRVTKILRKQAKLALKPMLSTARRHAPKRSGLLRKSLGIQVKAYANALWAAVGVRHGFRAVITDPKTGGQILADPVKYAHLVELGTRPHSLGRGARMPRTGAKAGTKAAAGKYRPGAMHPGTPPRAFMRKAFEAHRESAARDFSAGVVKDIEAAWDELMASQAATA